VLLIGLKQLVRAVDVRCRYASDVTAVSQTIADAAEKWHRRLRSLAGETFSRESIDVRVLPSYTEPL